MSLSLREQIIFLLACEWASAEQKAAPEISIQDSKAKLGEQFFATYIKPDQQRILQTMFEQVRTEVVQEIEKYAKKFKRKTAGIQIVKGRVR